MTDDDHTSDAWRKLAEAAQRAWFYVLDGHTPVREPDLRAWAKWFHEADRQLALTHIGAVTISTVFMGVDHNHSLNGQPVLFETMIFGGKHGEYCERCATWDEAQAMHRRAVNLVAQTSLH